MRLTNHFRSYFLRGLAVLLPTILTIWLFIWGFNFIQNNISNHINTGLAWIDVKFEDGDWNIEKDPENQDGKVFLWTQTWRQIAGFIIALIAVCIVGMVLASVVGRSLWRYVEKLLLNVPFIKRVYPYVKQITDFLLAQNANKELFLRVVAVQYPRKGIWSIGLVTGEGLNEVVANVRRECFTILIPTSPTPFTGFVIMVPKRDTIELEMTIEEAMRFAISAGVITPATKLDKYNNIVMLDSDEQDDGSDQSEDNE